MIMNPVVLAGELQNSIRIVVTSEAQTPTDPIHFRRRIQVEIGKNQYVDIPFDNNTDEAMDVSFSKIKGDNPGPTGDASLGKFPKKDKGRKNIKNEKITNNGSWYMVCTPTGTIEQMTSDEMEVTGDGVPYTFLARLWWKFLNFIRGLFGG